MSELPPIIDPREVPLGGLRGLMVHRTLPTRGLPTIGAWCFVDHFGPTDDTMQVLPHPHTGLQTVTWLLEGRVRHRDSLGSDAVLAPGELNLMTSGDGVSHSEFTVGPPAPMAGIQLWVALPEGRRHGPDGFEHHPDLPEVAGLGWHGKVLLGTFAGETSKATVHTPIMGAELRLEPGAHVLDLDPTFEYGLLAVDGPVEAAELAVPHRSMRYLAPGADHLVVRVGQPTTVLLLGGEPFGEDLVMWWNFIGRDHDEIVQARTEWEAAAPRFGHVEGHDARRIPAPPMPELRLKPRRRHGS